MVKAVKKLHLEYIIPILLFFIIFFNNLLTPFYGLDFSYSKQFFIAKELNNPPNSSFLFYLPLKLVLSLFHLLPYFFQIALLASMIFSAIFIKKLTKSYLSILIYLFNPFVYSRIMVAQLGILISYLLIPFFVYYLTKYLKDQARIEHVALSYFIASSFSMHFFLINVIIFLVFSLTYKKFKLRDLAKFALITFLLAFYWLIPFFSHPTLLSEMNNQHIFFFAPKNSIGANAITKTLGMWGFWREAAFKTSYYFFPPLLFLLLTLAFPLLLFLSYSKNNKKESLPYFILFWIGLFLALSISHPLSAPLFEFLFKYLPFFSGLRDSHKLVSLITLSYSFLIPKLSKSKLYKASLIVLVFLYSFPLIGLAGQMQNSPYPAEYYLLNTYLNNASGYIIYLPWQTYLTYNWSRNVGSDGRVVTPINSIVKKEVKIGPDQWGMKTLFSKQVQSCLNNHSTICLEHLGVQYIIRDKCAFFPLSYSFINHSLVFSQGCVELYKLKNHPLANRNHILYHASLILFSYLVFVLLLYNMRRGSSHEKKT